MHGRTAAIALALTLSIAAPARAADFTVTGTGDDINATCTGTDCPTLRAALGAAGDSSPPNTITVPAGEIQLVNGFLQPPNNVTITGAGARATVIKAQANDRVFDIVNPSKVDFKSLTMSGGTDVEGDGGGNLRIAPGSDVTLDHVRVTGGQSATGGGIFNDGAATLTIAKSLIDANTAQGPGGGIESQGSGVSSPTALTITDSTIAGNTAATGGGVSLLQNQVATTQLQRVTIARNTALGSGGGLEIVDPGTVQVGASIVAANTGGDCAGTLQTLGENVESGTSCGFTVGNVDPGLGVLSDGGGQTDTLPLAATSPAVDLAGACGPASDQRDVPRPQGLACDAGAYELLPTPPPPPPPVATPTPTPVPTATPSPTPSAGTTVVVGLVEGTIRFRRPGSNTFVELDGTQGIPVGSTVDTRDGTVRLTSQQKKGGKPQTATFFDGIFKLTQTKTTTDLTLNEALAKCGKGASAAAKKPKSRKLWGSGSGSFRTRGQYSAATVRGTTWLVQDSCAGTLTRVKHGIVSVRDNVKRKTILLRAGKRYLAKP